MAFPTTVVSSASATPGKACVYGPFLNGSDVYVVTQNGTTSVRVYKATDPTSSFSQAAEVTVTSGVQRASAFQVGSNLHIATKGTTGTDYSLIKYHVFSMSSDSFTTSNETVSSDATDTLYLGDHVGIVVRSDGDVLVGYNGPFYTLMGTDYDKCYYARKEGSWTADVALTADAAQLYWFRSCVLSASDRAHFSIFNRMNVYYAVRTLSSSNGLSTLTNMFEGASTAYGGLGVSWSSGSKVGFIGMGSGDDWCPFDSADDPSMGTTEEIASAMFNSGNTSSPGIAADQATDTLWCTYVRSLAGDDTKYYYEKNSGSGWGNGGTIPVGNSYAGRTRCAVYTRGSAKVLAIIYDDTYVLKYTEISAEAVSPTTGNAFGEQTPAATETAVAWSTWKDEGGAAVVVQGDGSWGKLEVWGGGKSYYSPVVDMGDAVQKWIYTQRDKYGTGDGVLKAYIRGSASTFLWNDGTPSWAEYTAAIQQSWQYVQIKLEYVSE